MTNLYMIGSRRGYWEVEANSLDDTIAEYAEHCADKEFNKFPDIKFISVFANCGDEEAELPADLVSRYESDLHDAIKASIKNAKM
jgi:hypothetical protein